MDATPLYFGTADRPLFGWLHASAAPASLGLVICKPFGYEAICAHRPLRHFADAAAAIGVPALRFDYDGTGDSAGDDHDPRRLAAWIESASLAADALRRHAGVTRVCFLGVRLGALIAARAAVGRDDCDGLIAIAPVIAGKAHLRELRALQMALAADPPPPGTVVDEGVQEAVGFVLTAETKAALSAQDLVKDDRPPAPAVLVLDRIDLPSAEKWAERMRAQGAGVERSLLPGYVEMVLDAEKSLIPEQLISATVAWLRPRAAAGATTTPAPPVLEATIGAITETAVRLGPQGVLFGVLATPRVAPPTRRGLVLLNAGGVHHVGPNRLWVRLARRWAARGHAVLRLDLSGLGDSRPRAGEPENVVYTPNATQDVTDAVAWLRRQAGVREVHALGLCSGAYNAFKAAVAGVALDGVVCINPVVFFYVPGMSLDTSRVAAEAQRYSRRARSLEAWKKLLRGEVQYRALARVLAKRAVGIAEGQARELLRTLRWPLRDDLAVELKTIARRGIALRFVFAEREPGLSILRTDGGSTVERLRRKRRLEIEVLEGPDHTFTAGWAQDALVRALGAVFDEVRR